MEKMSPHEAADAIRDDFISAKPDADYKKRARFAHDVMNELHVHNTRDNFYRVMKVLDAKGIEGIPLNDYPKWVENDRGEKAVVADAETQDKFMSRPGPNEDGTINPESGHVDPNTHIFTPHDPMAAETEARATVNVPSIEITGSQVQRDSNIHSQQEPTKREAVYPEPNFKPAQPLPPNRFDGASNPSVQDSKQPNAPAPADPLNRRAGQQAPSNLTVPAN